MNNELIWVESYRPKTIDDCILPERIKTSLKKMLETGNIQNYAAVGAPGSGKTSSARALCDQLGLDCLIINMSNESGIDTVRNKIVNYASTLSFTSAYKVIILDEFDHANKNSSQPALRGIIEEFQSNCRFIITANYKNKIIDAMYSRCPPIDFEFSNNERKEMLLQFIKRAESILEIQSVAFDRKELVSFCKTMFPDFRKTINLLQLNSKDGELVFTSLGSNTSEKIGALINVLKEKDFWKVKEWVVDNTAGNDNHLIRRALYDSLKDHVVGTSIPDAVLLINQYDFKEASVVDKEINMVAFLVELMMSLEFK